MQEKQEPMAWGRRRERSCSVWCLPDGWIRSWGGAGAAKCCSEMRRGVRRERRGLSKDPGEVQQRYQTHHRADLKAGWQIVKAYLNKAVILLSISWGTCWAGLFYWEGRSKIGKATRSCPVRTRELSFPQGMAALFVWENQDLSGHERKRRFQGFKVAAVPQWREAELKSWRVWVPLKALFLKLN